MDLGKQHQFIPKATADTFQTLKPKVKEHKKVVSTIREMEYYAKHVLTDSTTVDNKTRERCHNSDRMCADWEGCSGRGTLCLRKYNATTLTSS